MEPSRTLTAEEAAIRKSTDCTYFLVSPSTCKKGTECDFRHSEVARANPRDCWYWLNGNCMNPKCGFRHQAFDGFFDTPMVPSASAQLSTAAAPGAYNSNKQNVPCHFFFMGQCLKGDKCQFMHGPPPPPNNSTPQVNNHAVLQGPKVSAPFTGNAQTVSWGIKQCTATQSIPEPCSDMPVQVAKSSNKSENVPDGKQLFTKALHPLRSENETRRPQPVIAPVNSDSTLSRPRRRDSQPFEEYHQNGREVDEFLVESSPGFDVLVDDDNVESGYYNDKDYEREHDPGNFDYDRSEYEPIPSFNRDREPFIRNGEFHGYARGHNRDDRNHRRPSLERMDRAMLSRRRARRELSPRGIDSSDLRHRLLKQRRLNPDHGRDDHYGRSSGRDRCHYPQENSFSSRLQGRIKLPRRFSPDRPPIRARLERDRDRRKLQSRHSPVRSFRHQERTRVDPVNFAGPKSLAELKGIKDSVDGSVAFEAPKLLSSIAEPVISSKAEDDEDYENGFQEVDGEDDKKAYNDEDVPNEEGEDVDDDEEFAKRVGVFFS